MKKRIDIMKESEIIEELEITLGETAQQMRDTRDEMKNMMIMVKKFRQDYDELMDAVQYLSVMYGTSHEDEAMHRLQIIYTRLQNTWGG
jgi:hypothetical protein